MNLVTYKIEIDLQDGAGVRDITDLVLDSDFSITYRACSDKYGYAQNELSLNLLYDATLWTLIKQNNKPILITVYNMDLNKVLFVGHFSYDLSWNYNGLVDNSKLSLTATDNLDLLSVDCSGIIYSNCKVCDPNDTNNSILHKLIEHAGWDLVWVSSAITIPAVIDRFTTAESSATVLKTLDTLLYEYGYALNIAPNGQILPIKWVYEEGTIPSAIFDDSNIISTIGTKQSKYDYDGVSITYYDLDTAKDVLVYRDSNCPYADDGTFEGYNILAGYTYPASTNVIDTTTGNKTIVYQEYDDTGIKYRTNYAILNHTDYNYSAFGSDFTSLVCTENPWRDHKESAGIVDFITPEFYNLKCRLVYFNPTTDNTLKLYYNNVYADVWYRSTAHTSDIDFVTKPNNAYTYTTTYIFNKEYAVILAKALARQYQNRSLQYTFSSEAYTPEGSLVQIALGDGTNKLCFILSCVYNTLTEQYDYTALSTSLTAPEITKTNTTTVATIDPNYTYNHNVVVNPVVIAPLLPVLSVSTASVTRDATDSITPTTIDIHTKYANNNNYDGYLSIAISADNSTYVNSYSSTIAEHEKVYTVPLNVTISGTDYYTTSIRIRLYTDASFTTLCKETYVSVLADASITPQYLGRYYGVHPTTFKNGDWWLVYNDEGSTGGNHVLRGIYYAIGVVPTKIDPASTDVTFAKYRNTTLEDVLWAANNSYTLIGTTNNPSAIYGVNVMQYMAVNSAFVSYLGTNKVRLSVSGAIIGGARYNDSGDIIDATAAGIYISATGDVKFECSTGGFVIDSVHATVTYTGIDVDLTDSALVSYEQGSATPKSFSHENLALVVRSNTGTELSRLQYDSITGLFGGDTVAGLVKYISSWVKSTTFGYSTSLSSLNITNITTAINQGNTGLALCSVDITSAMANITLPNTGDRYCSFVYGTKLYMPLDNQNLMDIYDASSGSVLSSVPLSGSYFRRRGSLIGSKIYIPKSGAIGIEVINTYDNSVTQISTNGNSYSRYCCATYQNKIVIPSSGRNSIEIVDTEAQTTTEYILTGAWYRWVCLIINSVAYIPMSNGNLLEEFDLITNTVNPTTFSLSGVYSRYCGASFGNNLYFPIDGGNMMEIYNTQTHTTTTVGLSGSHLRKCCIVRGNKLYIPIYSENLLEIYDLITGQVSTVLLQGAYRRYTLGIYNSQMFIPNYGSAILEKVQLPYNAEISYSSNAWNALSEISNLIMGNLSITKMSDGRHMIVGEMTRGISYIIRAADGTYGTAMELQAVAESPTVALLPNGVLVCVFINSATGYIGRRAWNGSGWGEITTITVVATKPCLCVTEAKATLAYILTSSGFVNVIDCTDGTFGSAVSTGKVATKAQVQILPDNTYRMLYCLATGYLYTATGDSLSSWTNTELETAGVTDVSVGILGNGCTHVLYAKSSLFERTDNSAYSGINETKLMKSGMGIIQVSQDIAGTYYTLADGNVLRPGNASHPVGETLVQYPGTPTPATLYGGTWENISNKYAGNFFRTEGGSADPFITTISGATATGQVGTSIGNIISQGFAATIYNNDGIIATAAVASLGGYNGNTIMSICKMRPDNLTIRFWQRSA